MVVEDLLKLLEALKTVGINGGGETALGAHPYTTGKNYLIRTVTHYYTGTLVGVYKDELVLKDAAWIADTGRFNEALAKGTLSEVEPIPHEVIIGRGSIVDANLWVHLLPRDVK